MHDQACVGECPSRTRSVLKACNFCNLDHHWSHTRPKPYPVTHDIMHVSSLVAFKSLEPPTMVAQIRGGTVLLKLF